VLEEPKQFSSLAHLTPSAFACTKEPTNIRRKPIISSIIRTSKMKKTSSDTKSLVDEGKEVNKTKI
jgi:hypothetical protein